MSGTRVPETIDAFNQYIGTTDTYNQAGTPVNNGNRLGLSDQNITDWSTQGSTWKNTLFPKYSDPAQSTSVVKNDVRDFMKSFKEFASPLLHIIAASPNINNTDAAVYNVVPDNAHANPTHDTTPIPDSVMAEVKSLGGGEMEFTCRTSHDTKRASKAEGADSVQISFVIGDTPPANVSVTTMKEIFTKAQFILHAGAENSGKRLYVFMRWYNTKHPNLAGPWGDMITIVIG